MSETTLVYDVENCKPPSMLWLKNIIPVHLARNSAEKGIFSAINNQPYNENLWKLFEFSYPPLFSNKYHKIELISYLKEFNDNKRLSIASSIFIWNESMGLPILNLIDKNHIIKPELSTTRKNTKNKSKPIKNTSGSFWIKQCKGTLNFINSVVYGDEKVPLSDSDFCNNPMELLFEPCIIMQIPTKPTLLHQWLVLALSQVLLFEAECSEVKHWPIRDDIAPVINNLFSIIRELKNRIMLGFAILNLKVATYPNTEHRHSEYIIDIVVLPSIPTLQFLTQGTALKYLNILKSCCFNIQSNDISYVPYQSFYLDSQLGKLHSNFAYNFYPWSLENVPNLFPTCTEDLNKLVCRIKSNKPDVPIYEKPIFDVSTKNMSTDEKNLFQYVDKVLKNSKMSSEDKIAITIKVITEKVICKLEGVTVEDVKAKFSQWKKQANEIHDERKVDIVHNIFRQALMYNEAYKMLIGHDKESSVASQIISQQLYILEKEQLARLTNTCSLLFHTKLVHENQKQVETDTIIKIMTKLQELEEKIKNHNRKLFWTEFPIKWQKPFEINQEFITSNKMMITNLDDFFEMMLNYIGQISFQAAKESLSSLKFRENIEFKDWGVVQYLLPNILYSLKYECKINSENAKFGELLMSIVRHYQDSYCKYIGIIHSPEYNVQQMCAADTRKLIKAERTFMHNFRLLGDVSLLASKITRDVIRLYSNYLIRQPTARFRFKIEFLLKDLRSYHLYSMISEHDFLFIEMYSIVFKWSQLDYQFATALYNISIPVLNVHAPGKILPSNPKLSEFYYVITVLVEFFIMFGIETLCIELEDDFTMDGALDANLQTIHSTAHSAIILEQHGIKQDKTEYINSSIDYLYSLYNRFKKFRKLHGKIKKPAMSLFPNRVLYPEVNQAMEYFIDGNFNGLDGLMMPFFKDKIKVDEKCENKVEKRCRKCGKPESARKLIACEKCVKAKFDDVHYYCGRRCLDIMWKSDHMAEHLEHELNLKS